MSVDQRAEPCAECDMLCEPGEFHPFAACLMFKACHDGKAVRENLAALRTPASAPAAPAVTEDALAALLPGTYYMDPPDGGSVSLLEQMQRMAKDAARYRWLRDENNELPDGMGPWAAEEELDAAIDAALNREAASGEKGSAAAPAAKKED